MRFILGVIYNVGSLKPIPDYRKLAEGAGIKGEFVNSVADELLFGHIKAATEKNGVKSVTVPGYWYDQPGSDVPIGTTPVEGEKVALLLHGGGYITMSAFNGDVPAAIARGILEHCATVKRAFSVEYRLSAASPLPEGGQFPAALIDALNGYLHLLEMGFNPKDVVFVGDSAGGNLALALVRYLVEYANEKSASGKQLPPVPGHLVLLSPWADLGDSHLYKGSDVDNRGYDYIVGSADSHEYTRKALCAALGPDVVNTDVYFSPGSKFIDSSFAGFPRTFMTAGGCEMLYDQIETLKGKMVKELGDRKEGGVEWHYQPEAIHDWMLFEWHEPERTETLRQLAGWLD